MSRVLWVSGEHFILHVTWSVGFSFVDSSQGAAFAAIIAALLEKPETYPPFLVDGKPPHPPMCVLSRNFYLLL